MYNILHQECPASSQAIPQPRYYNENEYWFKFVNILSLESSRVEVVLCEQACSLWLQRRLTQIRMSMEYSKHRSILC